MFRHATSHIHPMLTSTVSYLHYTPTCSRSCVFVPTYCTVVQCSESGHTLALVLTWPCLAWALRCQDCLLSGDRLGCFFLSHHGLFGVCDKMKKACVSIGDEQMLTVAHWRVKRGVPSPGQQHLGLWFCPSVISSGHRGKCSLEPSP